jgi:Retroviral aspartyl protease
MHFKSNPSPVRAKVDTTRVETVYSLTTCNYKVSATVGVITAVSSPVRAILDTGAGSNLIRDEVLPEDWERHRMTGEPECHIVGAGGRRLQQRGVVQLYTQVGRLRTRMKFIVVAELAPECILGCLFINWHVQTILPKEKKFLLSDDSVVSIFQDSKELKQSGRKSSRKKATLPSTKVRVAKLKTLPTRTECLVQVQCEVPGFRYLQALLRESSMGVYMANGVAEILHKQPFTVRVINTSTKERTLPKGMILGHALPHPQKIVTLVDDDEMPYHGGMPGTSSRLESSKGSQKQASGEDEKDIVPAVADTLASGHDPPPLSDRPEEEEHLRRESVDLDHLSPSERTAVLDLL